MPPPPQGFSGRPNRAAAYGTNSGMGYPGTNGSQGYPYQNTGTKQFRTGQWYSPSAGIVGFGISAWIIFTVTSFFVGFFYHNNEYLLWIIVIVTAFIAGRIIFMNLKSFTSREEGSAEFGGNGGTLSRRKSLTVILASAWMLVAALSGFALGLFAHELYIRKFWISQEYAIRQNVLPTEAAEAYANAGEIGFAEEARIDLSKAIGYKDDNVYCVAPIAGDVALEKVQFWAAGMNCCGARGGFVCDDAWDSKARAGIILHDNDHSRLVKDMRPYYMNAVKMAEATYEIASAEEPVFVQWVRDPDTVERNFAVKGFSVIVCGIILGCLICGCLAAALGSASSLEADDEYMQPSM